MNPYQNNRSYGMNPSMRRSSGCDMNQPMYRNAPRNMNQSCGRPLPCNMDQCGCRPAPCEKPQPCKPEHMNPCNPAPCSKPCEMPCEKPAPCEPCKPDNSCREKKPESCRPSMSRAQLLNYINEVSFAKDEMILYLDTHPCDQDALEFCKKHVKMRNEALKEYAKFYGPLTVDTTDDAASDSWEWVMQPWPWEGGAC